jgi:uncharacterized protein (TIGR02996 family)
MSDKQGLLEAICDQPEDDAPRLVLADWLEEYGTTPADQAWAELIRLQCESARLPPEDVDADATARRTRLELRADELLAAPGERPWAGPVTPPPPGIQFPMMTAGRCVRGFAPFALGSPDTFLALGDGLCRIHPVHILWCGATDGHWLTPKLAGRLLAEPWLPRVRRMNVTLGGGPGESLLRAENLAGLEELTLSWARFSAPGAPVEGRPLANLRELTLPDRTPMIPAVVDRLDELLPGARLTAFGSTVGPADPLGVVRELAATGLCRRLWRLSLGGGAFALPAEAIRHLTAAPFWRVLRRLTIGDCGLGDEAAEALAEAPPQDTLRVLKLGVHTLTLRGLTALTASPLLRSVTALDLAAGTGIEDEGAALLARSPHLGNLAELDLAYARLGPKGVQAIAGAPWAANLVRLNLRDNPIGRTGVDLLTDPARFPRLLRLDLQHAVRSQPQKARLTARFGSGVRFVF